MWDGQKRVKRDENMAGDEEQRLGLLASTTAKDEPPFPTFIYRAFRNPSVSALVPALGSPLHGAMLGSCARTLQAYLELSSFLQDGASQEKGEPKKE